MQDGPRFLTEGDLNTLTTTKQTQYGAVGMTEDGRMYRYVSFGGTSTINPGLLVVSAAAAANSTGLAISAANTTTQLSVGSTSLIVTNGATAVTQDEFAFVDVLWTGGTMRLKLRGNTAAAASGAITLLLKEPLQNSTALVPATDTVNLVQSPYAGVITTTTVSQPIGLTTMPVPNTASVTNYGWVQTLGNAFATVTTTTKGQAVKQGTGTAGYVTVTSAATDYQIGAARESVASGTAEIYLNIH